MLQSHGSRVEPRRFSSSNFIVALVLLGLAGGMGTIAKATASPMQDADADQAAPQQHQMPSVDDQLQKLTQALTLTPDQQAKIKPMLEEQRKQMDAIRSESLGTRRDRFEKMRTVHSNTVSQVKTVLNEEQQKKYDELQEQMKEQGRKRMRRH